MYISSRTYSREMAAGSVLPERTSCGLVMIFSKMTSLVFSVLVGGRKVMESMDKSVENLIY